MNFLHHKIFCLCCIVFSFVLFSCVHKALLVVPLGLGSDTVRGLEFVPFAPLAEGSDEFRNASFPGSPNSQVSGRTEFAFAIAVTELDYRLWYAVRLWAEKKRGYQFSRPGAEGSAGQPGAAPSLLGETTAVGKRSQVLSQPVSRVTWGDAVVWANALTEYYNWQQSMQQYLNITNTPKQRHRKDIVLPRNLEVVYRSLDGSVLRSAEQANAGEFYRDPRSVDSRASELNGFRLPTEFEWELAGRWIDGRRWLAGNRAVGARGDYSWHRANSQVSWYKANSGGESRPPAGRRASAAGLYDMSGNLAEWVEDPFRPQTSLPGTFESVPKRQSAILGSSASSADPLPFRTLKGGAYLSPASELQVAGRLPGLPRQAHQSIGFRLALSLARAEYANPTMDFS